MLASRHVFLTVVSAMVGAGIFLTPGVMLRQGAPPPVMLGLFAAAAVLVVLGSWTLAGMAAVHPGNGGPYRYLAARLGPAPAFLYNWGRFWVMQCGALAVLSLTCVRFVADAMGVADRFWEAIAALALLAASAAVNARGLRVGARVQAGLTALKVTALLGIVAGALWVADPTGMLPRDAELPGGPGSWLLLAVFAFGGWSQVTFLAGEAAPGRLGRTIALAVLSVAVLYLVALAAMLLATPGQSGLLASDAAAAMWGSAGRRAVSGVIAIAVLGGLHTMTLTGPRLYATAAAAGGWWAPFGRHNAHGAPARAIWLQAEWAGLLVAFSLLATDAFSALAGGISVTIWAFHGALGVAWFRGEAVPIGATPGGRWTAGAFVVGALGIVALALADDIRLLAEGSVASTNTPWASLAVLAGVPVYLLTRRHRAMPDRF